MTLKNRFSLVFSLLFSVVLATILLVVYYLFANFRKEEFRDRLSEKAQTTARLLLEVKEVNNELLRIIDRNTVRNLYGEQILIFDDRMELIYKTGEKATPVHWSRADLQRIKEHKKIFTQEQDTDVLGLYYDFENRDYFVLVAAEDRYGNRKLVYLKYLLLGAFVVGTASVWLVSFLVSRRSLAPLERVTRQIREVSGRNLTIRLPHSEAHDEINDLSASFNQMMDRIDRAYSSQKDFTANASHELRTPLARIIAQLENLLREVPETEGSRGAVLRSIAEDSYLLSDIVTSLLLLSDMDTAKGVNGFKPVRLDEVVFRSAGRLVKSYPRFRLQFEIEQEEGQEISLEVTADETLLTIAVSNLLKNAYLYSTTGHVQCLLREQGGGLQLVIINQGPVPEVTDTATLFQTFTRGSNSVNKPGSGIGLSIVNRIVHYHAAAIRYQILPPDSNEVVLTFNV